MLNKRLFSTTLLAVSTLTLLGCSPEEPTHIPASKIVKANVEHCDNSSIFGFPRSKKNLIFVCHNRFSLGYDDNTYSTAWLSEHVVGKELVNEKNFKPLLADKDFYRPDNYIKKDHQPLMKDLNRNKQFYLQRLSDKSTWLGDEVAMGETDFFSNLVLANNYKTNQTLFKNFTKLTHFFAKKYKEVYVYSGVIFNNNKDLGKIGYKYFTDYDPENDEENGIHIPTHFYKIYYFPNKKNVMAYIIPNTPASSSNPKHYQTTLRIIEMQSGNIFFPLLKKEYKVKLLDQKPTLY